MQAAAQAAAGRLSHRTCAPETQDFQSVAEQRLFQDLRTTQVGGGQAVVKLRQLLGQLPVLLQSLKPALFLLVGSRLAQSSAVAVIWKGRFTASTRLRLQSVIRARSGCAFIAKTPMHLPLCRNHTSSMQSVIRDQERLLTAVLAALRSSQQVGGGDGKRFGAGCEDGALGTGLRHSWECGSMV